MSGDGLCSEAPRTYEDRLRSLQRRNRLTKGVGAGLVALAAIIAGDLAASILADVPAALKATFVTLFVLSGGALAGAYIEFEWARTRIERALTAEIIQPTEVLTEDDGVVPKRDIDRAERWWTATLVLAPATALSFLLAVWWSVA